VGQIPQPIDAVEELDSESVAPSNDSLISANKSKDVEEQAANPTEHMVSERNDEDNSLSVPEEDNDLDVEGSKAEDADHVISLCFNKVNNYSNTCEFCYHVTHTLLYRKQLRLTVRKLKLSNKKPLRKMSNMLQKEE